ncbi:MAG: hypothetical protein E4H14_11795 [Candidatus Thorarchaeota archaeon]|nr:MAG: hypothetical protein E4H14_11795 [Candidatus Thorarchaeota archaeon]
MQWEIINLFLSNFVMIIALVFIVALIVQAIFLGVGLGFVNGSNRELGSTFVTSLMMSLVTWIPCLGCILAWYFIKSRHNVGWGGALIAWLLGAIIMAIVLIAIMFVFFGSLFAGIFALFGGALPFTLPTP